MYPLKTRVKYDPNNLNSSANTFTTVYLWNYISWDFDEWVWSHLGVDIFPIVTHDNIVACIDWVVQVAENKWANGNYIIIKHENVPDFNNLSQKTTYYSCYLHLSEINVVKWDTVKEWQIIGKCWNTWNVTWSTWEHLHFQIDTKDAPFHPYWPFTMADASNAWLWFFEAVNKWLWIDNARRYTINPLVYLDQISNISNSSLIWNSNAVSPNYSISSNKSKYFTDVTEDIDAIDFLYEAWVTRWYEDKTFWPNNIITRAELLIMVYKFKKINPAWNGPSFTDVLSSDWFFPYISAASASWYVKWYPDWTFGPNNPVTRAEAIAIVLNIVVGKNNISTPTSSDFQDVQISDWYCKYTNYIAQNWLLDSIVNFFPNDSMTRHDLAILLYNLRDRV